MAHAITLVVLVAAGGSSDGRTQAMAETTRDALGPASQVVIREGVGTFDDTQAMATEAAEHADAAVELRWQEGIHPQALLRVHVARNGTWISRAIPFRASDAEIERGRAVGFAVASILPDSTDTESTSEVTPSTPDAAVRPASPQPAPSAPKPSIPEGVGKQSTEAPATRPQGPASAQIPMRFAVDLLTEGTTNVGGSGAGGGGGVAASWMARRFVSLRLGTSIRAAQTSSDTSLASISSAGVVVGPWEPAGRPPLGISLRVEYQLVYETMTRSMAAGSQTRDALVSGVGAFADVTWTFAPHFGVLLSGGVEDIPQPVRIHEGGSPQTLAMLRFVGEAGLRWYF